jgi:hypothetical protein
MKKAGGLSTYKLTQRMASGSDDLPDNSLYNKRRIDKKNLLTTLGSEDTRVGFGYWARTILNPKKVIPT